MKHKYSIVAGMVLGVSLAGSAVAQNAISITPETLSPAPIYRVNVISRPIQAVNYQHRGGSTKIDFAGTDLMSSASGEAKVSIKRGSIEIEAEFANLQKPTSFGNEYLTYILWAISPEGRAMNLGELIANADQRGKLSVTTDLQSFALIVTAEPYYAVRQPSNVVVLENAVRHDTKGTSETVNAKVELIERGGYIPTGYKFDPVVLNANLPLEFFEARNAIRIAKSEGAPYYASESYQHAETLMNTADGYATDRHVPKKQLIASSREVVQTAEDARAIAVKKSDAAVLANERQTSLDAQANSKAQAEAATEQKRVAEAEAAKAKTDANAAVSAAQADADKSRLVAQQAQMDATQANTDKAAMRTRLTEQLNSVLQTTDSARGLIINMSDVLFDTGKYSLQSGAREKLAKVAGILLSYPGLKIVVGGYTDNVGGDAMNQKLSENRASAVKDYLVQEGVTTNAVSSVGYGNTLPVASNDNASGRQQNRRVELVVSGDAIGSTTMASSGSQQ